MRDYASYLQTDRVAVFLFHGVVRESRYEVRNYTRKHLPLDDFVSVLRAFRAAGSPVSLEDLIGGRPLPPRSFVVTFDDGFRNNLTVAAPVLEEMGIPATFYVTTGFVGTGTRSWTDIAEAAVERVGAVRYSGSPPELEGSFAGEARKEFLDRVRRYVKGHREVDPYAFVEDLCRRIGVVDPPADPDLDDKLSWEEVRSLSLRPGFTVGGHGHTHRILEFLDDDELEREITTSVALLRAQIGPVRHYSYPEGLSHCYSDRVIAVLRRNGILCCPTAEEGLNRIGDDPFRLKRIFVV